MSKTPESGAASLTDDRIDALMLGPAGQVILLMGVAAPLELAAFRDRVDSYMTFALGGQMTRKYPETTGRRIELIVVRPGEPTPETAEILALTGHALAELEVRLTVRIDAGS